MSEFGDERRDEAAPVERTDDRSAAPVGRADTPGERERAPKEAPAHDRRERTPRPAVEAKDEATARPARQPHRVRRFVLRFLLVVLVLLVLLVVAVQLLLTTEVPRRLLVSALERQLGLRIAAESMETGWTGHTRLSGVTLSLPLADEAFLDMPVLDVNHTNPVLLLFRFPLRIHKLYLDKPRLTVRQDPLGRWNVEEALSLIGRASGGKANEEQGASRPIALPAVTLKDGTVLLIDNDNKRVELAPLELTGTPEGPLAWRVEARVEPLIRISGRVAPHQNWSHQIELNADQIHDVVGLWANNVPKPLSLVGQWRGQVAGGNVTGRLDVREGRVQETPMRGTLDLTFGGGTAVVTPQTFTIDAGGVSPVSVRVAGGKLTLRAPTIAAEELSLALMGGNARVNGRFDWNARAGQMTAAWTDLLATNGVVHGGSIDAKIDTPLVDRPVIRANVQTKGKAPRGSWDAKFSLNGEGRSWSEIDWSLHAPQIDWDDKQQDVHLRDLVARVTTRDSLMQLAELRLGETGQLRGAGQYDLRTRSWWLWTDTRALPLPRFIRPTDISITASGDASRVDLHQLGFRSGKTNASLVGTYIFSLPKPLDADLYLWRTPFNVADPGDPRRAPVARGELRGEAHLNGTLYPTLLDLTGKLIGNEVTLGRRELGDVEADFTGAITENEARIRTNHLDLLEGQWSLGMRYDLPEDTFHVGMTVENISLTQADALVAPPPNATGTLTLVLNGELPRREREEWRVTGEFAVRDFAMRQYTDAGLAAETVSGKLRLEGQDLFVENLTLRRGPGSINGVVRYDLNNLSRLDVELRAIDWPVQTQNRSVHLLASADTTLGIDLKNKSATGPISFASTVRLNDRDIGSLRLSSAMEGKRLVFQDLHATLLQGIVNGSGVVTLDDPLHSEGDLDFRGLPAGAIIDLWPGLEGLRGVYAGTVRAAQAINANDPEPLRLSVRIKPEDGGYHGMDLLDLSATFKAGPTRLVMDQSILQIAGGEARLWGRYSKHDRDSIMHLQANLLDLDLNQLVHASKPDAQDMVGRVRGEITAFGRPDNRKGVNAEATIVLRDSDLLNYDVINDLYRVANLSFGDLKPDGFGVVHARLEQQRLSITQGLYRNRGLEARGTLDVHDVFLGKKSPISGYAVGNTRPLSNLRLPFMAEFDDIIKELQRNLTTLRILGTIEEPRTLNATFTDVGTGLRQYILGEVPAARSTAVR